jgi:hypothetical protein
MSTIVATSVNVWLTPSLRFSGVYQSNNWGVGLVLPALPGVGGRLFVAIYADFILAINSCWQASAVEG